MSSSLLGRGVQSCRNHLCNHHPLLICRFLLPRPVLPRLQLLLPTSDEPRKLPFAWVDILLRFVSLLLLMHRRTIARPHLVHLPNALPLSRLISHERKPVRRLCISTVVALRPKVSLSFSQLLGVPSPPSPPTPPYQTPEAVATLSRFVEDCLFPALNTMSYYAPPMRDGLLLSPPLVSNQLAFLHAFVQAAGDTDDARLACLERLIAKAGATCTIPPSAITFLEFLAAQPPLGEWQDASWAALRSIFGAALLVQESSARTMAHAFVVEVCCGGCC